ncbi:hypothetical protein BH11PLA2_BH11PLA2_34930 [soil metagenome]
MLNFVGEFVLEVICGLTGHVVLWAVTFGRRKPLTGNDDLAALVGILFWVIVGIAIWLTFFR